MLILAIIVLILSFYLLAVVCEEFFVESLDKISDKLKLPSDVAGATLMAVGSSAPELFTSLFAVIKPGDHANVGAGTIVGSAIFNILVIIGVSAMFRRATLNWQPVVRDSLFYSISIVVLLITFWDGKVTIWESMIFVAMYVGYVFAVTQWRKWFPYRDENPIDLVESETEKNVIARISKKALSFIIPDPKRFPKFFILTFVMSIVAIAGLSFALVESAVYLGDILHINPTIIALTVLASGTSIPDLLSSVIVAKRGRGDMAVSNAIGSNVFDILFGLGFPWLLILSLKGGSITVQNENLTASILLLFATVISVFFLLWVRKWTIGKKAGLILVFLYLLYLGYNIVSVMLN